MRIGINLFMGLMIAVVGGVIFQSIIEMPTELYYNAEVNYTSHDYSYKPGQSGTTYQFYIKRDGRGYQELDIFPSIGVPTLFYFALLSLIGLFRFFLNRNKPVKEITYGKMNEEARQRIMKWREKMKKRNPIGAVVLVLFVLLFFYSGRNGLFGLGLGDEGFDTEMMAVNFQPTHLIYAPKNKGPGDIWMIQEDRSGEGATFIDEDQHTSSFDSIIYTVRLLDQKKDERIEVGQFVVSDEMSSFDCFYANGKVWLIARPNMMVVYDQKSHEPLYESIEDFNKQFDELSSSVHNFYRHDFEGRDVLRIEMLDGGEYYYHFDLDSLSESLTTFSLGRTFQRFEFDRANGERYNLTVSTLEVESEYMDDPRIREAMSMSELHFMFSHTEEVTIEDVFFIDPTFLIETRDRCFVLHKKDVSDNAEEMVSALDSAANILWSVSSTKFPKKQVDDYMPGDMTVTALIDRKTLVLSFVLDRKAAGMMGVDISSGKIKWKYNYSDLIRKEEI